SVLATDKEYQRTLIHLHVECFVRCSPDPRLQSKIANVSILPFARRDPEFSNLFQRLQTKQGCWDFLEKSPNPVFFLIGVLLSFKCSRSDSERQTFEQWVS